MMKAVIKGDPAQGNMKILFKGSHDECLTYMRNHKGWSDLIRLDSEGDILGYSSWVL